MTPDIRLEFRLNVKAGPQTIGVAFLQKSHAANEDLVRRPVSSTYDVFIGMQYGYTTAPHLSRVAITGPYNPTGPRRHAQPATRLRAARPERRRRDETPDARGEILSTLVRRAFRRAPTSADLDSIARASTSRNGTGPAASRLASRWACAGSWRTRSSSSASSRRRPASRPTTPYRISDTELASRLSFFLWSTIPDDELLKLADRGQAARTGGPREADAADARRSEGARARHQLRESVALSAGPEERQSRRDGVSRFRRQPASGLPAGNGDALRVRRARGPLGAGSARRGLHVRERAARQALRDSERLRSGLPARAGRERCPSRTARARQPAAGHVERESDVAGDPRQVDPRKPARQPGSAAAARRAAARGEADRRPRRSVRERIEQHRANPACAGCHKIMDPIGLALENFDAIGRWRTVDEGVAIDASAQLVDGTPIDGPAGLRKALLDRPDVVRRVDDGEAAHVRRRPRDQVLRHAGRAHRHARGGDRIGTASPIWYWES